MVAIMMEICSCDPTLWLIRVVRRSQYGRGLNVFRRRLGSMTSIQSIKITIYLFISLFLKFAI